MRMSEKCRNKHNNNSDNPLTSRRTDGGKKPENSKALKRLQREKMSSGRGRGCAQRQCGKGKMAQENRLQI